MTCAEAIRLAGLRLEPRAAEESAQQARLLMAHVLCVEPAALAVHRRMELTEQQLAEYAACISRREIGEPLQYIIGEWSFMGLPFYVEKGVLIPRPETELLCETALRLAKDRGYHTALDLCTGSGCIGVALSVLGGLCVTATDISPGCALAAEENAKRNAADMAVRTGDLFETVSGTYDLIVCNPPYLSDTDMRAMQPELAFEPQLALYGGPDGLSFYRRIAAAYPTHLLPNGALLLEIGASQAEPVRALFPDVRIETDYAGKPRIAIVEGTR